MWIPDYKLPKQSMSMTYTDKPNMTTYICKEGK
jgi:hypothetical protein